MALPEEHLQIVVIVAAGFVVGPRDGPDRSRDEDLVTRAVVASGADRVLVVILFFHFLRNSRRFRGLLGREDAFGNQLRSMPNAMC